MDASLRRSDDCHCIADSRLGDAKGGFCLSVRHVGYAWAFLSALSEMGCFRCRLCCVRRVSHAGLRSRGDLSLPAVAAVWEPVFLSTELRSRVPLPEGLGIVPQSQYSGDWARRISLAVHRTQPAGSQYAQHGSGNGS